MGVTRLKRKERRNKTVSSQRTAYIKLLSAVPVIKNVDIEEIKKGFEAKKAAAKPKAEKVVAPLAEATEPAIEKTEAAAEAKPAKKKKAE